MVAGPAIEFTSDSSKKAPVPVVATIPKAARGRDQCCEDIPAWCEERGPTLGSLAPGSVRLMMHAASQSRVTAELLIRRNRVRRDERAIDQSKESPYRIGQAVASVPASDGGVHEPSRLRI
jgi:hypothetical protein